MNMTLQLKVSFRQHSVYHDFATNIPMLRFLPQAMSDRQWVRHARYPWYSGTRGIQVRAVQELCSAVSHIYPHMQHSAMRERFMRNGEGFVLIYSITSYHTFEQVQKLHEQIARVKDLEHFPMVLVGNKCDLEQDRQVPTSGKAVYYTSLFKFDTNWYAISAESAGRDLAKQYNCQFFEASAKQNVRIQDAFHGLVREIRRSQQEKCKKQKQYDEKQASLCCIVM